MMLTIRSKSFIVIPTLLAAIAVFFTAPASCAPSSDDLFLDRIQYDSILYFVRETNPANGLIKDSSRPGSPASVAAVGFGLTAVCVGESRGWIDKAEAYSLVLKILKTFRDTVPNERGFFYHFWI